MKMNYKSNYWFVGTLAGMFFLSACDKQTIEYTPGQGDTSGMQPVYFETQPQQDYAVGENDTQISFKIFRNSVNGLENTLTQALEWSGETQDFTVPSSVTFAEDEVTADVVVKFDIDDIQPNYEYHFKVEIPDGLDTPYTQNSLDLTLIYVPWKDLGMCEYTDYFVGTFFGVEDITYEVKVMEHPEMPGFFRVVNPYGEAYPYNDPGDWDDSKDYFLYLNATNPEAVFISDKDGKPALFYSGMVWSYGEFVFTTLASYYLIQGSTASAAPYYGKYDKETGVITIGAGSTLAAMMDYKEGNFYMRSSLPAGEWLVVPVEETDE